jgi:hypothetical protein
MSNYDDQHEIRKISAGIMYEVAVKNTMQEKGFKVTSVYGVVEYMFADSGVNKQSETNINFVGKQLEYAQSIASTILTESKDYLKAIIECVQIQKSASDTSEEIKINQILELLESSNSVIGDDNFMKSLFIIKDLRKYLKNKETKLNKNFWALFSCFENQDKKDKLGHLGFIYRILNLRANFEAYKTLKMIEILNHDEIDIDIRGPTRVGKDSVSITVGEVKYHINDDVMKNHILQHLYRIKFIFKEVARMIKTNLEISFVIYYHTKNCDFEIYKEDELKDYNVEFICM